MSEPTPVSKLEQRMWTLIVGVALALGGIWLQNQYDTTLRLQEQLSQFMTHVDDKYVEDKMFQTHSKGINSRLDRIEDKIDKISDRITEEHKVQPNHNIITPQK